MPVFLRVLRHTVNGYENEIDDIHENMGHRIMRVKSLIPLSLNFLCVASAKILPAPPPVDASLLAAPVYEPARWNVEKVQMNNNCYAYAANDIDTEKFGAMPGKRTLNTDAPYYFTSYIGWYRQIVQGAVADGMIHTGTKPATKAGYYRVALMMHADYDGYGFPYWHWLRQGPDGYWSGKNGNTPATNLDDEGKPFKDPATAKFGFNAHRAQLVAYFLVPKGGLDVGEPNEPKTHAGTRPAWRPVMFANEIVVTASRHTIR